MEDASADPAALSGPPESVHGAPRARAAGRIESLDVLRGVAILLICLVNVPEGMGSTLLTHLGNVRLSGWSAADAAAWWTLHTFVEGTQRGMLQLLLGGSVILIAANAASAGVRPATVLAARYGSLALFGIVDIALIGWFGDILLEYSLAALVAALFRRLKAATLILLGAGYLVATLLLGLGAAESGHAPARDQMAQAASPGPRTGRDPATAVAPHVTLASERTDPDVSPFLAAESAAHLGGPLRYVPWAFRFWRTLVLPNLFLPSVLSSFFTILLGMGLFKLGFLQGGWTGRAYGATLLVGLAVGLAIRIPGSDHIMAGLAPPLASTAAGEAGRLALTMAYSAGLILLLRTGARRLLLHLAEPGRVAFSLYLLQNAGFLLLVFNGGGLALFGRHSWFGLSVIALVSLPLQVILSRTWLSRFRLGPLEWAWRSLAELRPQPLRRSGAFKSIG